MERLTALLCSSIRPTSRKRVVAFGPRLRTRDYALTYYLENWAMLLRSHAFRKPANKDDYDIK